MKLLALIFLLVFGLNEVLGKDLSKIRVACVRCCVVVHMLTQDQEIATFNGSNLPSLCAISAYNLTEMLRKPWRMLKKIKKHDCMAFCGHIFRF